MTPAEFLQALWGDTPPQGCLIQVWELASKRARYLHAPAGAAGLNGRPDVYTGVALSHKDWGPARRPAANMAAGIAGLWLDLDLPHPGRQTGGLIPTVGDALWLAHEILKPTLLVDSGHGVHAWWLLDQPWRFTNQTEQDHAGLAARQWYHLHRDRARQHGWGIDHTHDLARLLRLPGTLNAKGDPRPVATIATDGPRYTRVELLAAAAAAGPLPDPGAPAPGGEQLTINLTPSTAGDPAWLPLLLEQAPEIAAVFNHETPHPTWSASEWELSLASLAAGGLTDQQLADLIRAHRARWQPNSVKAQRVDYLARTVLRARSSVRRERIMELAYRRRDAA